MPGHLLDTHVVLWAATAPERLSSAVRDALDDDPRAPFVSAVSIAEMALKQALGKLTLPVSPGALCTELGFVSLPLTWAHAEGLAELPPLHRDPFDRLLVAIAVAEDLTLVTADESVLAYPGVSLLAV